MRIPWKSDEESGDEEDEVRMRQSLISTRLVIFYMIFFVTSVALVSNNNESA